jgi:dipeptidyl aminopeptidase/acylaminoacyl peptidase
VLRWLDRENRLILSEVASGTRAKLWSMDMATGKRSELSDYESGDENASDRWLYRKRFGDFARLSRVDVRSGDRQWITRDFDFDIESWSIAKGGKRIAVLANVAGTTKLKLYDGDLKPLMVPARAGRYHRSELAPQRARSGAVDRIGRFARRGVCPRYRSQHRDPLDRAFGGRWRQAAVCRGGSDLWRSFDNMIITGFLHRPNPREFPGKRPVIISIHGGLESLARPGSPRPRQLLDQRTACTDLPERAAVGRSGAASWKPITRKSARTGQGHRRAARLDSRQPDLDPTRVAVGASYGGFMAGSVAYAPRLVAAIDSPAFRICDATGRHRNLPPRSGAPSTVTSVSLTCGVISTPSRR